MSKFQGERLLEITDLMEGKHPLYSLPAGAKFSMNIWMSEDGLTGCAFGWAVKILPWFKRNFRLEGKSMTPKDAAKFSSNNNEVLGLTPYEFLYLFNTTDKIDRRGCARRIRKFVKERQKAAA